VFIHVQTRWFKALNFRFGLTALFEWLLRLLLGTPWSCKFLQLNRKFSRRKDEACLYFEHFFVVVARDNKIPQMYIYQPCITFRHLAVKLLCNSFRSHDRHVKFLLTEFIENWLLYLDSNAATLCFISSLSLCVGTFLLCVLFAQQTLFTKVFTLIS
jgi:hypothetical protein